MNNASFKDNKLKTRKYVHAQRRFEIEKENIEHYHQEKKKALNETRNLLTISFISIIFCLIALTGTTYAWFTATVSNNNNRIQAGTLEVGLLAEKDSGGIVDLTNRNANAFNVDSLTPENPVRTILTVQNNGTIDFKYALFFNITTDYSPEEKKKLSEMLKVYVREYVKNDTEPLKDADYKGTMASFTDTSAFISNTLKSTDSDKKYRVWIGLDSSADPETYKNKQIIFDIRLSAKQNEDVSTPEEN